MNTAVSPIVRAIEEGAPLVEAVQKQTGTSLLLNLAQFSNETYNRVLLHKGNGYELRLLCWKDGQSTSLHGHGPSECAIRVISGRGSELVLNHSTHSLNVGDVLTESSDVVHQVWCESETLVTLHAYRPALPVDQPSKAAGHRVVIVGGGWSGVATAIHLLATGRPELRIFIVEPGDNLGRGVAFGAAGEQHLLNVPAGQMSLNPQSPDDFVTFARARGHEASASSLLPRRLYGAYVVERLREAVGKYPSKLRVLSTEAVRVEKRTSCWSVVLKNGTSLEAEDVILATGHADPRCPEGLEPLRANPALIKNPWTPGALAAIHPDEGVLLVGTGLTALDVLISLKANGHRAPVTAASRHGWWPRSHLPANGAHRPYPIDIANAPVTADGLAQWFTGHVAEADRHGIPWQAVVSSVRNQVSLLWNRLASEQKTRFLERYWRQWETARHRAPAPLAEARKAWSQAGWLKTVAGTVTGAESHGVQVDVTLQTSDGAAVMPFDRIVLCTGAETDVRRFTSPLWRQLLIESMALPDQHQLGIQTTARGEVLGTNGVQRGLWVVGALRRPQQLESTSVPDLSKQTLLLARDVAASLPEVDVTVRAVG